MLPQFATKSLAVSPDLVQREVFNSMFEVHTAQLGIACGVLIALFFVYDRPQVGLFILTVLTFTALGYVPLDDVGRGTFHMMQKPWYFLLPLSGIPALYTIQRWVLGREADRLGEPALLED